MIKCFTDSDGYLRVDAGDMHPLIESYLEQDIQASVQRCDYVFTLLNRVERERSILESLCGNAHELTIRKEEVIISNLWAEDFGEAHIPIKVFRQCLDIWRLYVLSHEQK